MRDRKAERATDTMVDWWSVAVFGVWQDISVHNTSRVMGKMPESGTPDPLKPGSQFRPWKQ